MRSGEVKDLRSGYDRLYTRCVVYTDKFNLNFKARSPCIGVKFKNRIVDNRRLDL